MKIKFLILVFILFSNTYLYAQTAELDEINRNIRNEEAELLKLQSEKQNISKQIAVVSSKISNYRMLISELNKERKICENNIVQIRKDIKQTAKEIEDNKHSIAKSNMYVVDNMGYADIKIITTTQKVEDTVKILELLGKAGTNLKKQIDKLNQDVLKIYNTLIYFNHSYNHPSHPHHLHKRGRSGFRWMLFFQRMRIRVLHHSSYITTHCQLAVERKRLRRPL